MCGPHFQIVRCGDNGRWGVLLMLLKPPVKKGKAPLGSRSLSRKFGES
jgi:hypothetical protein